MHKTPQKTLAPPPLAQAPTQICVLGAGCSGLVALKALIEKNLPVVCFEQGRDIGGLWVHENSNGLPSAYESLHINTSTKEMEYSDFPMPRDIGDFPHHRHIAKYFADYADHFQLRHHIRFESRVVHCEPLSPDASGQSRGYRVTILDVPTGEVRQEDFAAIVVANGHHFSPALPDPNLTSEFTGIVSHSSEYQSPHRPHELKGKDVLVVGMGNSAMDIACELTRTGGALSVTVSARRGAWILPKYLRGKPIDQGTVIPTWLPSSLRRRVVTRLFEWIFGKMSDFGLPEPDHLIGEAHPTVSSDFPPLVASGDIRMRPSIARGKERRVQFSDGTHGQFDAIIYCTGFNVVFPFFAPDHLSAPNNELSLYHRAFHLDHRRVFFVGLLQTIGAVMPVAEAQARVIAEHLAGNFNLPDAVEMKAFTSAQEEVMRKRFVASKRHTMQVDPTDFRRLLQKDLILGRKRARRGKGIPFPGRNTNHSA